MSVAPDVGGVLLFRGNISRPYTLNGKSFGAMKDVSDMIALTNELKSTLDSPLIAIDHEGGLVDRFGKDQRVVGVPKLPTAQATKLPEAFFYGAVSAVNLSRMGISVGFNTVADRRCRESIDNPVAGPLSPTNDTPKGRAYADDPKAVRDFATARVGGAQMTLAQCDINRQSPACFPLLDTLKHYPGHGCTYGADPHHDFAYLDKTMSEIEADELVPFNGAMKTMAASFGGVCPMVMTGHITTPSVKRPGENADTVPVSLSPFWVGKLRNETLAGCTKPLIVSDALDMGAIQRIYKGDYAAAAEAAILAGNDLLILGMGGPSTKTSQEKLMDALCEKAQPGTDLLSRIQESYDRIRYHKQNTFRGSLEMQIAGSGSADDLFDLRLQQDIANEWMNSVTNPDGTFIENVDAFATK